MTKIKICGMKSLDDISYVNEAKPDFIGFVFANGKRKVAPDEALAMKRELDPLITAVGVFVDEDPKIVLDIVNAGIIDMIQLHGNEDKAYIDNLKSKTDKKIIKAARVKDKSSIIKAKDLGADYLLLDSYVKGINGGSGRSFDKSLIPKDLDNFFVAGGIKPEDIKEIISKYSPFAIDLSSGVETDGKKDRGKILKAVRMTREMD